MNTALAPESIKICISDVLHFEQWHIVETNAPEKYDGFGTFTIKRAGQDLRGDLRVVLVRDQHLEWQRARYASGLFDSGRSTALSVAEVAALFWKRIRDNL